MPPIAAPDSYSFRAGRPIYAGLTDPSPGGGGGGEPVPSSVPNELIVSLPTGSATNYPLQFGRAFAPGVVPGVPEVLLGGTPVAAQQADVKTRHADGSVKFAVLSVILPTIGTTEQTLVIGNKAAPAAPAAETVANMLANYDFEATIGIAVTGVQVEGAPVSARAMLQSLTDSALAAETAAGGVNSRYWTVGPVCTTVLLCDHATKAWDVGTNATKAIRPMFHVQFWPGIGRYHVRHIIEVADVTKLKDETGLDVTFTTGQASPVTRLSQSGAYVYAATFQSRAYWGGGADVQRANVKHGVAYLASTKAMPNYDASITMNASAIASYGADWSSQPKTLGSAGYWKKAMAATGGRPDLGLIPKWDAVAMYSGAAHMHEIAEAHAEMAGSWAFYFREGSSSKTIFNTMPGLGRIVSKLSRPTQFIVANNGQMVVTGVDGFTTDGTISTARDGWSHDEAHTPGTFWLQYLTTGSAFWHEKLMQLAAWSQFFVNPGTGYNNVANGASNTHIIMNGVQPRGYGWQMRNRARAWWAALDGTGEKSLLERSITDAVAHRAGLYDVPGLLVGNTIRDAWNANYASWYLSGGANPARPNALHFFDHNNAYTPAATVTSIGSSPDDMLGGQAPWMRNFISMCLYHAVELGSSICEPLAEWVTYQTILTANGPEPRHIADFIGPSQKTDNSYYQTLADIYDGWVHNADGTYPPSMPASDANGFAASGSPNTFTVTAEGYASIAACAIAMANGAADRAAAWGVVDSYHANTVFYDHDPRYAIIPRS